MDLPVGLILRDQLAKTFSEFISAAYEILEGVSELRHAGNRYHGRTDMERDRPGLLRSR